jgi:hypothetical protein
MTANGLWMSNSGFAVTPVRTATNGDPARFAVSASVVESPTYATPPGTRPSLAIAASSPEGSGLCIETSSPPIMTSNASFIPSRSKKASIRYRNVVDTMPRVIPNMVIHWAGGRHSLLRVKRNHTGYHRYTTDRRIVDVVTQLAKVSSDTTMANVLNRLGYKTGKGQSWNRGRVSSLRNYNHIPVHSQQRQEQEGWLNLGQAAKSLGVSTMSVHRLLKERVLEGQQAMPYAPWIIHRDSLNRDGIQAAVQSIKHGRKRPLPARLGQKTMDLRLTS